MIFTVNHFKSGFEIVCETKNNIYYAEFYRENKANMDCYYFIEKRNSKSPVIKIYKTVSEEELMALFIKYLNEKIKCSQ